MISELNDYLNEVGRYPVLTKEAQLLHCKRIRAWVTWPEGRAHAPARVAKAGRHSMDVMLTTNTRLVVSIAKRYQGRGLEISDLIQEGNIGLVRGLELFDPTRGYAVSTYSYWWIRQSISRAIYTHARTIRLPINTHELIARIQRFTNEYTLFQGKAPTITEIADYAGVTTKRVLQVLQSQALSNCASLDVATGDGQNPLIDQIPSPTETPITSAPEDALALQALRDSIDEAFAHLTPVEAHILEQVYFHGKQLKEIATELGFSRSRAGQLQRTGINKLKLRLAPCARDL